MNSDRDYNAEILELVQEATTAGDFVARLVADDIVDKLRANDPDLLAGWLNQRAGEILGSWIAVHYNGLRNRSRAMAPRRAFAEAAERFTGSGGTDTSALDPFSAMYVVDHTHLRRRVADMTGADHTFVADRYADDKNTAAMLEAFHRAVAKRVGDKRTEDVYSAEQYMAMYRSITRANPAIPKAA